MFRDLFISSMMEFHLFRLFLFDCLDRLFKESADAFSPFVLVKLMSITLALSNITFFLDRVNISLSLQTIPRDVTRIYFCLNNFSYSNPEMF